MHTRSGDKTIKLVSLLAFTALVIYIAVAAMSAALDPFKTVTASTLTLDDVAEISGYIVRTETVLSGSGYVITASEGEKVSMGQAVAVKYIGDNSAEVASRISELRAAIDQLEKNRIYRRSPAQSAADSILELSKASSSGDMTAVGVSVTGVRSYIMGESGTTEATEDELKAELSRLETEHESAISYVKATASGIFSSVTDGYEYVTLTDVMHASPAKLSELYSGSEAPPGASGKIITGLDWYYAAIMDEADSERFSVGDRVTIDFESSFGRKVTMTVLSFGAAENGKRTVVFTSNRFIADIASLRLMPGSIKFSSISGIRVPTEAIHYDEDGSAHVFVLAGLQARRVEIEILSELSDCVIAVQSDESGSGSVLLRSGSEIIVKAKGLYDGKVVK